MKTTPNYVDGGTKDPRDTTKEKQSKDLLEAEGENADEAKADPAGPAP